MARIDYSKDKRRRASKYFPDDLPLPASLEPGYRPPKVKKRVTQLSPLTQALIKELEASTGHSIKELVKMPLHRVEALHRQHVKASTGTEAK